MTRVRTREVIELTCKFVYASTLRTIYLLYILSNFLRSYTQESVIYCSCASADSVFATMKDPLAITMVVCVYVIYCFPKNI
jgi:hypothetical protein